MEEEQINQTPPSEEATTIGMFLKYTRLKQKKSIEAVSDALCIRKLYIKALEEDDYQTLPPIPYGVGFIRSYAAYLGLNASRIAQIYKQQAFPKKEKQSQPIVRQHTALTIPHKKYIYFGLGATLVLYLLWVSIHFISAPEDEVLNQTDTVELIEVIPVNEEPEIVSKSSVPLQDEQVQLSEKDTAVSDAPQVVVLEAEYVEEEEEEEEEKQQPQKQPDEIRLKFKGESWIELKDKNKVYVSGIRQKGFEFKTPYVDGMILSLGKYYNVDVYINNVLTQVAGPRKQTNINLDKFIKH